MCTNVENYFAPKSQVLQSEVYMTSSISLRIYVEIWPGPRERHVLYSTLYPYPPLKWANIIFWSQKMRNVLRLMQN